MSSAFATWTCGGVDCPWGPSTTGHAAAWPTETSPISTRYDYTVSHGVYLPAAAANGATIRVESEVATIYAGRPNGPHRFIAALTAGGSHVVGGIASDEVVSLQAGSSFTYSVVFANPGPPVDPPTGPGTAAALATWTCGGVDCPWGPSASGHAAAWPAQTSPISTRYDYAVSHGVYLPAGQANGASIRVESGGATIYAGRPNGPHRFVAALTAGGSHVVGGIASDEVVSLQAGSTFNYSVDLTGVGGPGDPGPIGTWPPNLGPMVLGAVSSVGATWACDTPACTATPRTGAVIDWPEWSAYSSNGLADGASRTVHDGDDQELHPYMGAWADGCTVTAAAGNASVIIFERGVNTGRTISLATGQSYQITFENGDNGAIIESVEGGAGFAVSLSGCEPAAVPGDGAAVEPDPTPPGPMLTHAGASQSVVWQCGGTNCPWGEQVNAQAAVWPAEANPLSSIYDYAVTHPVYLTAAVADGLKFTVTSGQAGVFRSTPGNAGVMLASLSAGQSYVVTGLGADHVVSLESEFPFTYDVGPPGPPDPNAPIPIQSVATYWHCNTPNCNQAPWTGRVIDWTHWSSYPHNNRTSNPANSRTTYDSQNKPLHPYMGPWANGCIVTAVTGQVLIIEWERGTDVWRETYIDPGESHTITLVGPENGALIESNDIGNSFSVTLENCEPEPLSDFPTTQVPEPAANLMLLSGLALMSVLDRRRAAAKALERATRHHGGQDGSE